MSRGELVFLVWNDLVGLNRTRGIPAFDYERRKDHGLGWAMAGQALTPFDDIAPNPWGPMEEVRQTPDDSTRRRVSLRDDMPPLHMVMCNSMNLDGSPWECCTRSFMAAALYDLEAETGLQLHIAYENEFLLTGDGLEWAAPFSFDAVRRISPFADLCTGALIAAEVGLETFEPEFGVGQFEVSCGPAVGMAGADRVILTREVVREAARQSNLNATFTPKPAPEAVGNGCHLHISLWDKNHKPAGFDPEGPGEMSQTTAQFVAGVKKHMQALIALTAPSPVSYLRLGPHHWACGYDAVGVQNREAAIRICPSPDPDPKTRGNAHNIEIRSTDATASPYLAIGSIVRAGLEGIRAELPVPPLANTDPADMTEDERKAKDIRLLPASLDVALDAFLADDATRAWFTPTMVEAYSSVKRLEADNYNNATPEFMCERYARVY